MKSRLPDLSLQGEDLNTLSERLFAIAYQEHQPMFGIANDGTTSNDPAYIAKIVSILGSMSGLAQRYYSKGESLRCSDLYHETEQVILEIQGDNAPAYGEALLGAYKIAGEVFAELLPPAARPDKGDIPLN